MVPGDDEGRRAPSSRSTELVRRIAKYLYEEGSWWWDPEHEPTEAERKARALDRSREAYLWFGFTTRLADTTTTYEGDCAEDDLIVEARQQTVRLLALAFWLKPEGAGFDRVRAAAEAADKASQALWPAAQYAASRKPPAVVTFARSRETNPAAYRILR